MTVLTNYACKAGYQSPLCEVVEMALQSVIADSLTGTGTIEDGTLENWGEF